MKILIKNAYNTYNYGTMMMCENIIAQLNDKISNVIFYIDNATENNIERLKEATRLDNIYSSNLNKEQYKFKTGILAKIERKLKYELYNMKCIRNSKNYDCILILGGDDYAETYTDKKYALKMLKQLNKTNNKSKVIMIGQTIGPYTEKRKKYAQKIFKKIKIYTRDDVSSQYLINELNANPIISRDLALLDLKLQSEYNNKYKEILKKYNLENDNYIVVVGTGLAKWYCSDEQKFNSNFIKIIEELSKRYKNKKIVWLSHVTTEPPELSDNTMLNNINSKNEEYINKNMIVINKAILPVEARIILGHAHFSITCRMHAAVSSFQMGKPAICLSYSPKYRGVIADALKMPELVIEAKSDDLWNDAIVKCVNEKIEYVEKNYDILKQQINDNINVNKKNIENTLNDIKKIIVCE